MLLRGHLVSVVTPMAVVGAVAAVRGLAGVRE